MFIFNNVIPAFYISNELLIGVLVFILVLTTVFKVMSGVTGNKSASLVVAVAASLLAAFYLRYDQILFLIQTYGLAGVIILIFFPFLIAFYFVYTSNAGGVLRKIFLVLYGGIVLFTLNNSDSFQTETMNTITIVFGLIIIVLLIFDKTIKNKISAAKNLKQG